MHQKMNHADSTEKKVEGDAQKRGKAQEEQDPGLDHPPPRHLHHISPLPAQNPPHPSVDVDTAGQRKSEEAARIVKRKVLGVLVIRGEKKEEITHRDIETAKYMKGFQDLSANGGEKGNLRVEESELAMSDTVIGTNMAMREFASTTTMKLVGVKIGTNLIALQEEKLSILDGGSTMRLGISGRANLGLTCPPETGQTLPTVTRMH
jgi:hypothetical protein